jgi:hypothetical protein
MNDKQNNSNSSDPPTKEDTNLAVLSLKRQIEEQQNQIVVLQASLQQKQNEDQTKLQEEARKQREVEQTKLEKDADLHETLANLDNDKYESLTNRELVDVMASAVEQSVNAKEKQLLQTFDSKIADLGIGLSNTQKAIMQVATAIDVKEIRGAYKDFDEFQKEAATIMQDTPGISVKDAYLLAKARKLEIAPSRESTDRERVNTSVSRSPIDRAVEVTERRRQRKSASEQTLESDRGTGVTRFRSLVDSGINRVLANRGEE